MTSEALQEYIDGVIFDLSEIRHIYFAYNPKIGLYHYQDGIYQEDFEEGWLRHFLRNIQNSMDTKTMDEIIERIKQSNFKPLSEFDKIENNHLIPLLNLNYNLKTNSVEQFDPSIISTSKFLINYNPDATCPTIDKFLESTVHKDDIPIVEELFGFLLSKRYEYKYLFIFYGGIDAGKGTLLELIEKFLGGNVCFVQPHKIITDEFAAADLYQKRANISGDISAKYISDTSMFKMLIGNDGIQANKKYGARFTFRNYAKLIFGANSLPTLPDNEMEIFMQKVKIIRFPYARKKSEQDVTILERMTTDEELSGLFNKAVKGIRRLRQNKDFSNALTKEEMLERYLSSGDPVTKFTHDMIDISITDVAAKDDILSSFKSYCEHKKISYPKPTNTFWRTLKASLPKDLIDYNRRIGSQGSQKYAIGGIRLRDLSELSEQIPDTIKLKYEVPQFDESKLTSNSIPQKSTINELEPIEPQYIEPNISHPFPEPNPEHQTKDEVERINALIKLKQEQEENE